MLNQLSFKSAAMEIFATIFNIIVKYLPTWTNEIPLKHWKCIILGRETFNYASFYYAFRLNKSRNRLDLMRLKLKKSGQTLRFPVETNAGIPNTILFRKPSKLVYFETCRSIIPSHLISANSNLESNLHIFFNV